MGLAGKMFHTSSMPANNRTLEIRRAREGRRDQPSHATLQATRTEHNRKNDAPRQSVSLPVHVVQQERKRVKVPHVELEVQGSRKDHAHKVAHKEEPRYIWGKLKPKKGVE